MAELDRRGKGTPRTAQPPARGRSQERSQGGSRAVSEGSRRRELVEPEAQPGQRVCKEE